MDILQMEDLNQNGKTQGDSNSDILMADAYVKNVTMALTGMMHLQ